jgi:hypothetical protein
VELPEQARRLAARQDDVITRIQLISCGVTLAAIRWNGQRHWQALLPRVFYVGRGSPHEKHRLMAAQLYGGDGAVIGGAAAARLHGVTGITARQRVRVLVPPTRKRRVVGFAEVRPTLLDDPCQESFGRLRLSSRPRAVVDAAVAAPSEEQCRAIVLEAVQRRIVRVEDLAHWAYLMNLRHTAAVRRAIDEAAGGAWSVPEGDLLRLLRSSAVLPEVWPNPSLKSSTGEPLISPDAWVDDVAMAVMVHSRKYHSTGKQWEETVDRDGGLTRAGVVVAGVTPSRIKREPAAVLRQVEETYAVARGRPRPAVHATRRYLPTG